MFSLLGAWPLSSLKEGGAAAGIKQVLEIRQRLAAVRAGFFFQLCSLVLELPSHVLLRGFKSLNMLMLRSAIYNSVSLKCIEFGLQLSDALYVRTLPDILPDESYLQSRRC